MVMDVCLFVCPDVFFSPSLKWANTGEGGPARGGKLIIYNRGTEGGDQRVKESEWKM
jgi:hypothetical protein